MSESEPLGGDFRGALENVTVPSYVLDKTGFVRWINPAAMEIVDVRDGISPRSSRRKRPVAHVSSSRRRSTCGPTTETEGSPEADRDQGDARNSAVPLRSGDHIVGVFGPVGELGEPPAAPHPDLTPRRSRC
jgi:hypothetical protein